VIAAWLGLLLSLAVLALPVFKDHDGGARWVIGAAVAIAATILVLDVAIPYRQERQQRPKTTESCQRRMPRLRTGTWRIFGWWRAPPQFLEVPVVLVGPMLGCMCYGRVRRRSR
jgi:hypothetical protein